MKKIIFALLTIAAISACSTECFGPEYEANIVSPNYRICTVESMPFSFNVTRTYEEDGQIILLQVTWDEPREWAHWSIVSECDTAWAQRELQDTIWQNTAQHFTGVDSIIRQEFPPYLIFKSK